MRVKVLTVIGTRPEAIKLFPLIHAFEADPRFESQVCVTGQHRELVDRVLVQVGVAPNYDLDLMRPGQTPDTVVAGVLAGLGPVLDGQRPGWVVVQGDTTSAFASAISAHHRKVPVVHVEAGLRSGNMFNPWPEEANRKLISALASLHLAPTTSAAAQLRSENIAADKIFVTGNTGIDALHWMVARADRAGVGPVVRKLQERFNDRLILLVTLHRRESIGSAMDEMACALARLARRPDIAIVFPMHPNCRVRSTLTARLEGMNNVALMEPLDYDDFVQLLRISYLVLTDSGGIQEEAPALGKPVLVLRETTERPEGLISGAARLLGTGMEQIVREVEHVLRDQSAYAAMAGARSLYGDGHASRRIVEILASQSTNA